VVDRQVFCPEGFPGSPVYASGCGNYHPETGRKPVLQGGLEPGRQQRAAGSAGGLCGIRMEYL